MFVSKQKDSKEFKTRLGLLYYETEEIKHTNKDKERDTKDKKFVLNKDTKLYNLFLETYAIQYISSIG